MQLSTSGQALKIVDRSFQSRARLPSFLPPVARFQLLALPDRPGCLIMKGNA